MPILSLCFAFSAKHLKLKHFSFAQGHTLLPSYLPPSPTHTIRSIIRAAHGLAVAILYALRDFSREEERGTDGCRSGKLLLEVRFAIPSSLHRFESVAA
mmetsp:Transcript_245/g.250  ORF Transcript_245/g.250 Transcript_245/m.250 type:complete len:99 (+) Transcript_245:374-670(+)